MSSLEAGILAIWNDCRPGAEAEYEAWYMGEHLRQRVALPGFKFARRYETLALSNGQPASPGYFTYYETTSAGVLSSPAYVAIGANPTPLTAHMMSANFSNMTRTVLRREHVDGDARGSVALTLTTTANMPDDALDQLWARLLPVPGRLKAELWTSAENSLSAAPSAEEQLRGRDRKISACVVIDLISEPACAAFEAALAVALGAEAALFDTGRYRLMCTLDQRDLRR